MKKKVQYAELRPKEFRQEISRTPVAYLPLGTLEWHGEHLPLGSDGIQSNGLFERLAEQVGGVVCPMLFLGPDRFDTTGAVDFYGMDIGDYEPEPTFAYPTQQLTGSAYWIPVGTYLTLLEAVIKQLKRAGIKILVAHGHGPSTHYFRQFSGYFEENYAIKCLDCWGEGDGDMGYQIDHAAMNETAIMLGLRPDLVEMEQLSSDLGEWPLAISGKDPRKFSTAEFGETIIQRNVERMAQLIRRELNRLGG